MTQAKRTLPFLQGYSPDTQAAVHDLIDRNQLGAHLRTRYQPGHAFVTEAALYRYVQDVKDRHLRRGAPVSKVCYDDKIHVIHNALGMHSFVTRIQGNKLKAKHEIRIATLFKHAPEAFLRMIVVHELAHLREKAHNKAFYNLCCHMEPDYHQLEFDLRLYLTHQQYIGERFS